jgi:putative tryptophan/tyrosine transport system substrate-binding protein
MKRREFITLIGSAAVVWPFTARAQQPEQMRRIGMLLNRAAGDPEATGWVAAFQQVLQQLGWRDGRNVQIDIRWGANDADRDRRYAAELAALAPDVILAAGSPSVAALQQVTRTLPIVFVHVTDPVGAGFVDTLARPGGNTTGFMLLEYSSSGKWLELLKQIAPQMTRAGVLRDPANPAAIAQFGAIQASASSLGVDVNPINVRDASEIERAVANFARSANGGLIITGSASGSVHRDLIVTLAARHKLPAVYALRTNVIGGGLISYGPSRVEQYRHAADYVDRILKGAKPADLPVQAPTKYELVINLKTAKAVDSSVRPKRDYTRGKASTRWPGYRLSTSSASRPAAMRMRVSRS